MAEEIVRDQDEYVKAKENVAEWLSEKIGNRTLDDFEYVENYVFAVDGILDIELPLLNYDFRPILAAIYEREIGIEMHPQSKLGDVLDIVFQLGEESGFAKGQACEKEDQSNNKNG
jgi:hypothetical protein